MMRSVAKLLWTIVFLRPTTLSEFGVASIFDWACTFLLLSVTKPKLEFNFLLQLPTENCVQTDHNHGEQKFGYRQQPIRALNVDVKVRQ